MSAIHVKRQETCRKQKLIRQTDALEKLMRLKTNCFFLGKTNILNWKEDEKEVKRRSEKET